MFCDLAFHHDTGTKNSVTMVVVSMATWIRLGVWPSEDRLEEGEIQNIYETEK